MIDFNRYCPPGLSLYPFQRCGIATSILERRTILGDEVGLGKTVQALIALEATRSYPALVVCPASLRANWAKEVERWLPKRSVTVCNGVPHWGTDVTIASYDSLHKWQWVLTPGIKGFVCDESHYVANPKARRSKAALSIARRIPGDGLVLALTGTPILNRPAELIGQLMLIDRLRILARPGNVNDPKAWRKAFLDEWCKDRGSLWDLHRVLRQTCYIRRRRQDVLGRRPTDRYPQYLSLPLAEYQGAERDFLWYLREHNGLVGVHGPALATGLNKLTTLYRLVGEAKVGAAIEWVDNFLYTNPDRSLLVFAHHRAVQEALVRHYGCPHVLAGQRDVEAQKARFASQQSRLMVCSLGAAREGHTLTAAADVLFTELPWSLGVLIQAEARINRIGQERADTSSWVLLGAGTIDERIWDLLQAKQDTFDTVVEGLSYDRKLERVARQLFSSYAQRAA